MSGNRKREALEGYLFLLPNLLGFLIFMAVPLAISLYYSFTDYNLFTEPNWVGVSNYGKALGFSLDKEANLGTQASDQSWVAVVSDMVKANDPTFWVALGNTIKYAFGVLLFSIIPSFLIAWILNSKMRGVTVYRAMIYIPVVASVVGSSLVWFWIFQQQNGVLNTVIRWIVDLLNNLIFIPNGNPIACLLYTSPSPRDRG